MWTRQDLKWRAKNTLSRNIFSQKWLMATVSVFIAYVILSLLSFFSVFISFMTSFPGLIMAAATQDIVKIFLALIPADLILVVLMVAVYIFLWGPLFVGMIRYFLANRDPYDPEAPSISLLFSVFRKGQYLKVVAAYAWMMLFLFLWFIIPIAGFVMVIIKGISYSMVPFILAENPQIDYKRALKMSIYMTDGQKGAIFVLILSFLGWMILGEFALFIGIYWAYAYFYATYAELYDVSKKVAISRGICMPQEFGINPNGDPNDPYATPLDLNNPYIRNPYYSRRVYPQYQWYYNNYNQQNYYQPNQPPYNNTNYYQPYQQQGNPYQNNMDQNYNQNQYYNQSPTQNPQNYNQQAPIDNNPIQSSDSSQASQQQQNNMPNESQDSTNQDNNPQA